MGWFYQGNDQSDIMPPQGTNGTKKVRTPLNSLGCQHLEYSFTRCDGYALGGSPFLGSANQFSATRAPLCALDGAALLPGTAVLLAGYVAVGGK